MNHINKTFKQLAIIGSTASGKTALSIELAKQMNAYILSLDSLAIYKEIDIVSAKPTIEERAGIKHFGLDYLSPDESFDVTTFIKLYHTVYQQCIQEEKNLIIVGGTSFYLKMLIEGISDVPKLSPEIAIEINEQMKDAEKAYHFMYALDPLYMQSIASNDTYRIRKALELYFETHETPSTYFKKHPPIPTIKEPLPIYQIVWEREKLRKRIALRTKQMINDGLIDEIVSLEKKYTRLPNCMKAIGIKETLSYLDGIYDKKMLVEKITTNTARLAKRQTTFNNSQFNSVIKGSVEALEDLLLI